MYFSGIALALLVFAATYFHRQVGLIVLLFVGLICIQGVETPNVVEATVNEVGQGYGGQWNYSSRITFSLSVILFFTAIVLKRWIKRKNKLN